MEQQAHPAPEAGQPKPEAIVIKKYANRRLYNTATSSYVTLEDLAGMVREGLDFVVYDARSGEDLTRPVLTQIIVEQEGKGQNLLPIGFLRQLIGFYGNNMQGIIPSYLDHAMKQFSDNQERIRDYYQKTFGSIFPFGNLKDVGKQNMEMFERAMRFFSPFNFGAFSGTGAGPASSQPSSAAPASAETLASMEEKLAAMRAEISAQHTKTK